MAIGTSTQLQTAVANWLARADLTSRIPEFIALAEARMKRKLRTLDGETKASFSITGEYVAVPNDFVAVRSFQPSAGGLRYSLKLLPDELQNDRYPSGTDVPKWYSVVGSNFRFAPIPDTTYTATLVYQATLTALNPAGGSDYNWILTNHPDVYLYGSLLQAAAEIQNDERIPIWKAAFDEAIFEINAASRMNKWSGPGLAQAPG